MIIDIIVNAGGLAGSKHNVGAGSGLGIRSIGHLISYIGATVAREGRMMKGFGERLQKEDLQKNLKEKPALRCVSLRIFPPNHIALIALIS